MKTLSKLRSLLLATVVTGLLAPQVHADAALRNMQGGIASLDQHQTPGQWTVVMIWASDCHSCNQESGHYASFHTRHAGKDVNVIGVSIDGWAGRDDAQAFIDRNGVNFPNLIGDVETVARWYAAETGESFLATPTFLVYGPQGEIRAAQAGAVAPDVIEEFIRTSG